jgi:hypothetical protein
MSHDAAVLEQLPPEKLLDTSNYRVITPAITMMGEVETVEQYLEYERAHRNRGGIIRRLTERRDAIYEERGETLPIDIEIPTENPDEPLVQIHIESDALTQTKTETESESRASGISPSPSADVLALVHEHRPTGVAGSPEPPAWDEL